MKDKLSFIKTNSTKVLLLGYFLMCLLTAILLVNDLAIQEEQISIIDSSVESTTKMKTIIDLIEVARMRVALSHTMLSQNDVFEKDEISQHISDLGEKFIINYQALHQQNLTPDEQKILTNLNPKFEDVRLKLRNISALALEDNEQANIEAKKIVLNDVVPSQQLIINDFIIILSNIQKKVHNSRKNALVKYMTNNEYRVILISLMLVFSLIILIWVIRKISSIENQLKDASLTDGLTKIANRRSFDIHLKVAWNNCKREQYPLSIMLIDIDYFKKYNDLYGHQKGDECLTRVASIIKAQATRDNDLTARYGGEEFAIILPNTNADSALFLANNLIKSLHQEKIPHKESSFSQYLTLSIGVASIIPSKNSNFLQLIKSADEGLYQSKNKGRNQVNCAN